jgi:hypothetical protein
VAIDESLAVMRMLVASVNVTNAGVRKFESWDDLTELEQEPHMPVAMIAFGIVWILNEHRGSTLIGDLRCLQIISIHGGAKNLRKKT